MLFANLMQTFLVVWILVNQHFGTFSLWLVELFLREVSSIRLLPLPLWKLSSSLVLRLLHRVYDLRVSFLGLEL